MIRKAFLRATLTALTLFLCACGLFRQALPTPVPTPVVTITAAEAARAMDEDRFWSSYGHTALLVTGTIASLDPHPSHFIIVLDTGEATSVRCDLGGQAPAVKAGDAVTVRTANPENDVQREAGAVLIQNCSLSQP